MSHCLHNVFGIILREVYFRLINDSEKFIIKKELKSANIKSLHFVDANEMLMCELLIASFVMIPTRQRHSIFDCFLWTRNETFSMQTHETAIWRVVSGFRFSLNRRQVAGNLPFKAFRTCHACQIRFDDLFS